MGIRDKLRGGSNETRNINDGEEYPSVSFFKLFRYADAVDITCITFGILLSIGVGVAQPSNAFIFRNVVNEFTNSTNFKASTVYPNVFRFAILGTLILCASFAQAALLGFACKRQVTRIRKLYFKAVLRQDVPWFDVQITGALINKLCMNTEQIETGIGAKLGEFTQNMAGFIAGIIIAFAIDWELTLVACAMFPLVVISFTLLGFLMKYFVAKELAAYSKAGAIAGEVLSIIRTVVAFGGEKKELSRYSRELTSAEKVGIKKNMAIGGVAGAIGLSIFGSAALIFWYGFKLLFEGKNDPGGVILVFVNVLMGSIYLGNALPNFQYFMNAKTSAREIYGTIQRIPPIDKDGGGTILPNFMGNVTFTNISFAYPSRPDTKILENFNLNLKSGQTVALVGPSGSGKSTIIHMLQRFYDPIQGNIKVEGVDIRDLDLKAFRAQLGCVQQEPVLFEGSISDNIRMGKLDATQDEIEEAAKQANAHGFILEQPNGYDTIIGERGGGLSGGQKQRIAIARALIRKPKLLLLDEATSALDTKSERIVQEALEKASEGRTVVVVAHRLTTVRNADLILVLERGVIRESGTHDQLVNANGLYAAMLRNQKQGDRSDENEEDDLEEDVLAKPDSNELNDVWQLKDSNDTSSDATGSIVSLKNRLSVASVNYQKKLSKVKRSPFLRMLKLNRPEVLYIVMGCFCSIIAGGTQPAFAVLYSEVYGLFTDPDRQNKIKLISGMMGLLGFIRFFSMLGQGYFFGVSGERLTSRVRSMYFEAMLRQEIGWFDMPENQAGALTAKLATEASKLKSISGSQLGTIMEATVLVITSLVIAFVYSWQLTLLFLAFFPLIVVSGMFQVRSMAGAKKGDEDQFMMRVAQEAISNDRTVFTLGLEDYFYEKFTSVMDTNFKAVVKDCMLFALVYAMTQCINMFAFSAVFALGAHLMEQRVINQLALFRVFAVMNMGAQSLGRTASFGPEAKKAAKSARLIMSVIDRQSLIPVDQGVVPQESFSGKVSFKRVYFRYPTRPTIRTLKNFSHTVNAGQTVALVGPSGCGKSTLLQLVQRFYDPSNHGKDSGVFFDNHNIKDLAPWWVRKQIGIVSQEPNLFNISLRDNIAYGDNSREVPMEEIVDAARKANIHDFISSLPEGYETIAGERGSQLSGGQKQRVAIARALLRNPKLLLLDEATSALDTESERIVQESLDKATGGRTSLVVAHRLSTVVESDLIVVLDGGRKIETGPPAALLAAKGAFYALHAAEDH